MDTYTPKNTVNTSKQIMEYENLKNEIIRLRENNVDLKLKLIESTEKLNRISKIIEKTRIDGTTF